MIRVGGKSFRVISERGGAGSGKERIVAWVIEKSINDDKVLKKLKKIKYGSSGALKRIIVEFLSFFKKRVEIMVKRA